MYSSRIENLRQKLTDRGFDAILVVKPENQYYLSGFDGEGFLLIGEDRHIIFTDFRYVEEARDKSTGAEIIELKYKISPYEKIAQELQSMGAKKVAVEGHYITLKAYEEMKNFFAGIDILSAENMVEDLRTVKDETELNFIKKAQSITDRTFSHILDYIRPGVSEADIALEIEYFIKRSGADGIAFPTIAVSGHRTSLPHGKPSERKLQVGDIITLDFGAKFNGYCSDMTRTIFLGEVDEERERIYNIVLEAQRRAIECIKAGVHCKEVDNAARSFIEKNGFGKNFGHGLGHGVGLEIHGGPRLSPKGDTSLLPGMVVTVEPGIYVEGFGGVRIEDLVIVTDDGCIDLTQSPKDIICL